MCGQRGAASLAEIRAQRIRLAKAAAERQELKNVTARGELVEAATVAAERTSVLRTARAAMLALPNPTAQRLPHLPAQ